MLNIEQTNAFVMIDLAVQKLKDANKHTDQALIDIHKRNEELADKITEIMQEKETLIREHAESIALGRRAQAELKQAEERIEEYEKLLHKT